MMSPDDSCDYLWVSPPGERRPPPQEEQLWLELRLLHLLTWPSDQNQPHKQGSYLGFLHVYLFLLCLKSSEVKKTHLEKEKVLVWRILVHLSKLCLFHLWLILIYLTEKMQFNVVLKSVIKDVWLFGCEAESSLINKTFTSCFYYWYDWLEPELSWFLKYLTDFPGKT